jgi:uncharacterized protein (TIGR00255 family)
MTGFGRAERSALGWRCQAEIRSVNGRFLETRFKLPVGLGQSEDAVRDLIRTRCVRGKIDGTVNLIAEDERAQMLELNGPMAQAYGRLLAQAGAALGRDIVVTLRDLVETKDLVTSSGWEKDAAAVAQLLAETVDSALSGLVAMRETEGRALETDLRERLSMLRRLIGEAEPIARDLPAQQAQRLQESLARLLGAPPPEDDRIRQEIALLADRSDVSEELTRFAAHLDSLAALLNEGGPIGRKFEFVLQELNRETNTLSVKCPHPRVGALAVDIKAELEKLREQIQNVE